MQKRKFLFIAFLFAALVFSQVPAHAQCAMCKSNIEKAREDGSTQVGNTLNNGILYLLVLPYAIASVFGYIYYKKYKEKQLALKNSPSNIVS
ncbi:MAG: hypothetical protein CFE21_12330 [Bacteroidetes bacterium B1(2017)]|nr:MAG: hypothetical protein CFE21_12330 [Bacteroidetes bacterium B1(2017)]